jgi:hypothetical protein
LELGDRAPCVRFRMTAGQRGIQFAGAIGFHRWVNVKQTIFWAYSLWFRYAGLAMAILSGCVSVAIAFDIATHGYVLANGQPSMEPVSIAVAVCIPLVGVAVGMALFYFVPKVPRKGGSS